MPRSSMAGSLFPDLEQEQRSSAHPSRARSEKDPKSAENSRNSEESHKNES